MLVNTPATVAARYVAYRRKPPTATAAYNRTDDRTGKRTDDRIGDRIGDRPDDRTEPPPTILLRSSPRPSPFPPGVQPPPDRTNLVPTTEALPGIFRLPGAIRVRSRTADRHASQT
ncbi:hypothetical protein ABT099_32145 [Streptomyces prasinus]|uniref:hypothetical protein n=1 Tax=Streptomyces prasinus TaxID=67345 RepID=UPI00332CE132